VLLNTNGRPRSANVWSATDPARPGTGYGTKTKWEYFAGTRMTPTSFLGPHRHVHILEYVSRNLAQRGGRHELCAKNPIEDVRQGSKRLRKPATLALDEVRGIMYQVTSQAIRVAILVAVVTGFRRSEIRGLKWRDVDFVGWTITPVRGSTRKHLSNLKSDASGATVPIPEALVVALQQWRTECLYPGRGLDFCLGSDGREVSAMVRRHVAATASPCCNQGGDHKACRLAYLPAFACSAPGQEARRDKGGAGTHAPRRQPDHSGHLQPE
jgi:integrase